MSLKRVLKNAAGVVCENPLFRPWIRDSALRSINVVYYHYVGDPGPHYQSFYSGCTLKKFANDLRLLQQIFDFTSLKEVLTESPTERKQHRPILAVTFDDGLDLNATGAMAILERYGVKATTFVITSCIGNRSLMWRHKLSAIRALAPESLWLAQYNELAARFGFKPLKQAADLMRSSSQWDNASKEIWAAELWGRCHLPPIETYLNEKRPYFDKAGLHHWLAAGHSIGFHTHTHSFCSRLSREDLNAEIVQPALDLKREFDLPELYLSYPFGDRLRPELEQEVMDQGIFIALFGIRGLSKIAAPRISLERVGVEGARIGWALYSQHLRARAS